jgi:hypothetical protein
VSERQLCQATTATGEPCRAQALPGARFCVFHDPAHAEARAAGRKAGGKRRSQPAAVLPADTADAPLTSVPEVVAVLADTINQMRTGRLDVRVGNGVTYACATLLRALQPDEAAKLAEELRRRIEELKGRRHGDGNHDAPGTGRPPEGTDAPGGDDGDEPAAGAFEGGPEPDSDRGGDGARWLAAEVAPLDL